MRHTLTLVFCVLVAFAVGAGAQAGIFYTQGIRYDVSSQTIADNGNGATAATGTLTVLKSYIEVNCQDANGCTVTIGETGARQGQLLTVVNISANTATFADSSGVTETAGSFAAGQYDAISYVYMTDRWVELARSNN